jgi:hypothetical protein
LQAPTSDATALRQQATTKLNSIINSSSLIVLDHGMTIIAGDVVCLYLTTDLFVVTSSLLSWPRSSNAWLLAIAFNNNSGSGDAQHAAAAVANVTPVSAWRVPSALDSEHDADDSGNAILPVQIQAGIPRQSSRTRKGWSKQPLNSILGHVRQRSSSCSNDNVADDTVLQQQEQQQQQQQSMNSHDVYTNDTAAVCDDIEYTEYEDDFELTHDSLDDIQQHNTVTDTQLSGVVTTAIQPDADAQHRVFDIVTNDDDGVADSSDHIEIIDDTVTTDTATVVEEDASVTVTHNPTVYDEPMTVSDISSDDDTDGDTDDLNNDDINDDTTADNITTATTTTDFHDDSVVSQQQMNYSTKAAHTRHSTATLATAGNVVVTPRSSSSKGKRIGYCHTIVMKVLLFLHRLILIMLCDDWYSVHTLTAGAARRVEIVTSLPRMQTHHTHHTNQSIQSIVSTEKRLVVHQLYTDNSYDLDVRNRDNRAATTTTDDTYEHDAYDDSSTQHKAYTGSCSSVSSSVVSSSGRQQSNAAKDDTVTSQPAHKERHAPDTVSDLKCASNTNKAKAATAARCVEADSSSVSTDTTATGLAQDTESLPLPPLTVQQELAASTNFDDSIISGNVTPPQALGNDVSSRSTRIRMSSDAAGNSGVQASDTDTATNTQQQQHVHTNVNSSSTVVNAVPDIAATASITSNRPAAVHSSDDMPVIAVHSDSLKCHTHASGAALQQSALLPASAVVSPGKSDDTWPIRASNSVQQQQQPQQQQTNSQRLSRAMALAAGVLRMAQNHYQHTAATATATTDGSTATTSIANRCK